MGFREPQTPGLGGIDELTNAETSFVTGLASLAYVTGDILYYDGAILNRLPRGTNGQVLELVSGIPSWQNASSGGVTDHGALTGLGDDDHTQYALLAGRAGGQTLYGGTASGNDLTLFSTSHSTKGTIFFDVASANTIPVSGGSNVDPYIFAGESDAPYLYIDRNTGATHIGWGAQYTAGSFTYRNSHRFYFDTDFNGSGVKGTYIEAVPTDPGGQQQFKVQFYVDGTLQFALSGVAGVVMPNGFTAGALVLSGDVLRGANSSQIIIRGEANYAKIIGERNSVGDYDVQITGRQINGGATASNLVGFFNDNTVQSYFDPIGGLVLKTVGSGFALKEGTNATMGTATLSGGTVVVSTTKVTANSRIFLTVQGGTLTNVGTPYVSARTAGTSFTISSVNPLDASNVGWIIIEPS